MEPRTAASVKARPEIVLHGLKPEPRGWLAWHTMTDHERIGIMFGPTGTAGTTLGPLAGRRRLGRVR